MKNNEEPSALAPPRHHHIHDQHHHQQLHHYRPPPSTRISCASRRWKLIILESHTEVVVLSMSGPLTSHLSYFIKYTSMYCSLWGRSCTHNDLQHTAIYIYFNKKLKNVSCEYNRLNGWNSTLQAAWYIILYRKLSSTCVRWHGAWRDASGNKVETSRSLFSFGVVKIRSWYVFARNYS